MSEWFEQYRLIIEAQPRILAAILVVYLVGSLLETWVSAESGQSIVGRLRNIAYFAVYLALGSAGLALWYAHGPILPLRRVSLEGFEKVLFIVGYMLMSDVLYYWYHRAQHRYRFLWAMHELHHSDAEMNVTTSHRTWWLELPVQTLLISIPLVLAFGLAGPDVGLAIFVAMRFSLYFTHCNLKLRLGPLTPLFCGPQVHRIHHSRLPEHQDRNFAQTFPFLDILFGTYHAPGADEFPPTGAPGLASDAPIWRAQLQPFLIWAETLRIRSRTAGPSS